MPHVASAWCALGVIGQGWSSRAVQQTALENEETRDLQLVGEDVLHDNVELVLIKNIGKLFYGG